MKKESVFRRVEHYVAAATIAAHAHFEEGFRQRDVRFLIELCSNWTENIPGAVRPTITNTQVFRYLELLVAEGYAKRAQRQKQPHYRLTRLGLIVLVTRTVAPDEQSIPDQFLFRYYFVLSYRARLLELIEREGTLFPLGLKLELEALLDTGALLKAEIDRVERMLVRVEARRRDGVESARLAAKLFATGHSVTEVVNQVEARYPYELNSQKPLSELIGEMPEVVARWELETGTTNRVHLLWNPAQELLKTYLKVLRGLQFTDPAK